MRLIFTGNLPVEACILYLIWCGWLYLQVVGLTASVGVGKKANLEGAVEHIVKLCAHMDALKLCTVTQNVQEQSQFISQPTQGTHRLSC